MNFIKPLVLMLLTLGLATACSMVRLNKELSKTVVLPADDGYLSNIPIQWWYWSGHLESREKRRFGFEVVFFSLQPNFQFAQAAITDIDHAVFHYDSVAKMKVPKTKTTLFELSSDKKNKIQAKGGNGIDFLQANINGYRMELKLNAVKQPLIYHDGKPYYYSVGGHTYSYSRTRMEVSGVVVVDEEEVEVTGSAWFDRQYGDLESVIEAGWQWFAIQLDDNTEITVVSFDEEHNHPDNMLVVNSSDNESRKLSSDAYQLTTIDFWRSPVTGCNYPIKWLLKFEGKTLEIDPYLQDQELRPKTLTWLVPTYWEGAAEITGDNKGKAYVELHGFCPD